MLSRIFASFFAIVCLFTGTQASSPVLLWSNAALPRSKVALSTLRSLNFLSESICNLTNDKVQLRLFVVDDLTQNEIQQGSEDLHPILTEARKSDSAFRYFPNVADDIYRTLSMMPQSNNMHCAHIRFDLTSTKEFMNLNEALESMDTSIKTLGSDPGNAVVMALLSKSNLRTTRSRRSVEDVEDIIISDDGTCMFYATQLIVTNRTTSGLTTTNYTLDTENSVCQTASGVSTAENNNTVTLKLVWFEVNDENSTIDMTVDVTKLGSYWYLKEAKIGSHQYRYFAFGSNSNMDTPSAFSYVCTTANFVKYDATTRHGQYDFNQLAYIKNLQFQPFLVSGAVFGTPNYCTSFFTGGIWMGITTSLLCFAILLFGVGRMMNIKSNDRLDDPKGKPLVIKAQE